jgi:membrane fusion protein, adhesin transport system
VLENATRRAPLRRRLTQPLALEDGRPPRVLTMTLYTFSGFVVGAIAWGVFTEVREVTNAPGQIVPRAQIQPVQHLEGGLVAEIYVHEGAHVTARQPLIRLQPEGAASDRNQLESRRASLKLQLIRLQAQSLDSVPDFSSLRHDYPDLVSEQEQLYFSAVAQRQREEATLMARASQKRSDIAMINSDLLTARAQAAVQLELFNIQESLRQSGNGARKNWLEAKAFLQRADGEVMNLQAKLATAQEVLAEAQSSLEEARTRAEQKVSEERVKAGSDLSEVEQQLIKISDRYERLLVRAPSEGVVQELIPKAQGEVVRPGDLVARIVPINSELVAEVRIDAKDSGHIKIGADADIRLATYDSAIFGTLHGKVEYVSPTTFFPPSSSAPGQQGQTAGEPYYKAIVRLSQDHVGYGAMSRPISAGMSLQAQIKTGSKSIFRYMFKPVLNSLDQAFSER